MTTHRRGLLAGLGLTALAGAAPAVAQTPTAAPKPTLAERLAARAAEHRWPVTFANGRASGPGVDRLIEEGKASEFFLLGEEHGLAEVPALVSTLLPAAGFVRLGLEVSPPGAAALDTAARGGVEGLKRLYAEYPPGPAFYTMAEEARMLADMRVLLPDREQLFVGLDYEVLQDRLLIDRLKAKVPASARAPLAALEAASKAGWAKYEITRNLTDILPFSGDPALVSAVETAWNKPDHDSAEILWTLRRTLEVNRHYRDGRYFESNAERAEFSRACWSSLQERDRTSGWLPKTMFKFGAGHMVRGRSMTEVYDLGSLVSESAELVGWTSFHLLVIPLNGKQAYLDAKTLTYAETNASTVEEMALEPHTKAALPGASTLIDLRPLRPLMSASVTRTADPRLTRIVHGYDMLLFVDGATASTNL
ncbi:MAG: hypothetical protein Q7J28_02225 [Caulobacter sp.]|nr:hypothetical protein [Caulobacter sp.]